MESYVYKIIPLEEISRDFPYLCRYRMEDGALADSVARHGLIQPLISIRSGHRILVSGHRRFRAAEKAGLGEISVFEIQKPLTPQELFLVSILSNWNQIWSDLDRAWAVRKAARIFQFEEEAILRDILPAVGLAGEKHLYEEYLEVSDLDPAVLDLLDEGQLPFRGVRVLSGFGKTDQREFALSVATKLSLTTNQLLKTAEWLNDLLKINSVDLKSYLARTPLAGLLNALQEDRRQKTDQFTEALRRLRFPRLSDREEKFASLSHEIREGAEDITIERPVFFEGEGITLKASIKDSESVERILELIQRKRKLLSSLFDIMV